LTPSVEKLSTKSTFFSNYMKHPMLIWPQKSHYVFLTDFIFSRYFAWYGVKCEPMSDYTPYVITAHKD
jgi:hypothetical protein